MENLKNDFISKFILEGIKKDLETETKKTIKTYKKTYNKKYNKNFKMFLNNNINSSYNFLKKIIKRKIELLNSYISNYNIKTINNNLDNINVIEKKASQKSYKNFNYYLSKNLYNTFDNGYKKLNDLYNYYKYDLFINYKNDYNNYKSKKLNYKKLHKIFITNLIRKYKKTKKDINRKFLQKSYSYKINQETKTIYNNNFNNYYIEYNETLLNDSIIILLENKKQVFYNKNKMILSKKALYKIYAKIEKNLKYYNNTLDKEKLIVNDENKNFLYLKSLFNKENSKKTLKKYDFINNIDFTEKQKTIIRFLKLNISKIDIANNLNISKQLLNKHINIIKNKINKYIVKNAITL